MDHQKWMQYYSYKESKGHLYEKDLYALKQFIDEKRYLNVAEKMINRISFKPPKKIVISKHNSTKKRIVYSFMEDENNVLKLLTFLLQRKYDYLFSKGLYSFRPMIGAKDAIDELIHYKNINKMWGYKVDIKDYFNSVDVSLLLQKLQPILKEDSDVFDFIKTLLEDCQVIENGNIISEKKGIMAGTPIASFLANVYLMELDAYFENKKNLYARYSDDIIIFSNSKDELEKDITSIHRHLHTLGLAINPKKEMYFKPKEKWTFLGFSYQDGVIDVSDVSIQKLKAKMKRKTRALMRWKDKKGVNGEKAAKAFIRIFNEKLFENPMEHELTWIRWYFPMITTTKSLEIIDHYSQQCIRYLVTGTHTKASYNCRYEKMKELGYRSLVHAYYKIKEE